MKVYRETSPAWPGDPDMEPDRLLDDEIDAVLEPRKARQRHDNRLALHAARQAALRPAYAVCGG
jgi:hypothetical protein